MHTPALPTDPSVQAAEAALKELMEPKDIKTLLKDATPKAIRQLVALATDESKKVSPSVRLAAIQEILNREMGKVTQPIEANGSIQVIVNQLQQARYADLDHEPTRTTP